MQERDGALRMRGGREDRPPVVGQDLEPACDIGRVVGPGLQLRYDAEIRTEQGRADLGDQLFPRAFAAVTGITAEIAADAAGIRRPVRVMPISA